MMRKKDENSMKRIMTAEVKETPQSRMTEDPMGRHDTSRHKVSLIKDTCRTYCSNSLAIKFITANTNLADERH